MHGAYSYDAIAVDIAGTTYVAVPNAEGRAVLPGGYTVNVTRASNSRWSGWCTYGRLARGCSGAEPWRSR